MVKGEVDSGETKLTDKEMHSEVGNQVCLLQSGKNLGHRRESGWSFLAVKWKQMTYRITSDHLREARTQDWRPGI